MGWVQVTDEASGRLCYYNTHTEERSWKPPRISQSRTPPPNGVNALLEVFSVKDGVEQFDKGERQLNG